MRLGSVAGSEADAFGQVMALEADRLGRIYVADGMSNEIRVFTPDGRHLRTVGGAGSGPGEFRMLSGMAWGPDGRLWVMDPTAGRITTYDTTGALAGTHSRDFVIATTIPWGGGVDLEGNVYDWTQEIPQGRPASEPLKLLVRYRPRDDRLVATDTLAFSDAERETYENRPTEGIRSLSSVPFSSVPRRRLAPDGSVWIGTTGDYRLARVNFTGDTIATLQHSWEPVAVSRAERDSVAAEEGVPADRIPGTKPAFRSFFVDAEGRVWVEPHQADESGTTWDVFSDAGEHLGRVHTALELETEVPSPVARDDRLYAVLRDELDVSYVVRLRIPELPSPDA